MPLHFIKMHGSGNDFAIFDARARDVTFSAERVHALADRHTGIGFDQCIILHTSTKADVFMQIINADGSEVSACGNASRCVGWLIANEKNATEVSIETKAGILQAKLAGKGKVTVNMGKPKFGWQEIPLASACDAQNVNIPIGGYDLPHVVCVNMGNPHAVFFVDEHARIDLADLGPKIEHHNLFPERVNVSIARILSSSSCGSTAGSKDPAIRSQGAEMISRIKLDVWERGAGITLACGTAACATLVAAAKKNLTHNRAEIELPGGILEIFWDKTGSGDVWMTGAVAESFRGVVTYGFD